LFPILIAPNSLVIYIFPISLQSILISGLLYALTKPTSISKRAAASTPISKMVSLVLIIFSTSLLCSFILGVRFLAITSGSMMPSISIGDVVVSIPVSISDIQPGNIIVFKGASSLIVHRVLQYSHENCYVTKGDANESPDPLWACGDNIVGKVVMVIPLIGLPAVYLLKYTGGLTNSISLVIALLSLIYVYYIVREVVVY
jgi:signal peptidase